LTVFFLEDFGAVSASAVATAMGDIFVFVGAVAETTEVLLLSAVTAGSKDAAEGVEGFFFVTNS